MRTTTNLQEAVDLGNPDANDSYLGFQIHVVPGLDGTESWARSTFNELALGPYATRPEARKAIWQWWNLTR